MKGEPCPIARQVWKKPVLHEERCFVALTLALRSLVWQLRQAPLTTALCWFQRSPCAGWGMSNSWAYFKNTLPCSQFSFQAIEAAWKPEKSFEPSQVLPCAGVGVRVRWGSWCCRYELLPVVWEASPQSRDGEVVCRIMKAVQSPTL